MTTLRGAIYTRASQDREGRATSVDDQDRICRALAERRGVEIVANYRDNDIGASSLSKKKRPDFARMMEDAEAGRFDVILAYSTSRLTRRPREFETIIELAEKHGTKVYTDRSGDPDFTTAQGRGVARTLAAWDAVAAEQTGENVASSVAGRLAKGEDLGGSRPFGFEPSRTEIRESEAKWIREAYRRVLDEHEAVYSVAKWLSEQKVPTAGKADLWTPRAVRALLLRPRNAGVLMVNGIEHPTDSLPAIVSREDWLAMTALLNNPDRAPKRGPQTVHLLSGIAKCAVCGYTLAHTISRKGRKDDPKTRAYGVYRCSNNQPVGRGTHPTMRDEALEDAAVTQLLDLIADGGNPDGGEASKLRTLTARLNEIAEDKAQATTMGLMRGANLRAVQARLDELEAEREAREAERDALLSDTASGAAFDEFRAYVRANVGEKGWGYMVARNAAWEVWEEYDIQRQRAILRGFEVKLHPTGETDRVTVTRR